MSKIKFLKNFEKEGLGNIRVATLSGEPLFNLYDTCFNLGYTKSNGKGSKYLFKDRIENICGNLEIKGVYSMYTKENLTDDIANIEITKDIDFENTWISEQNFYDLCLESHAKNARPFRKWVTGDVLPSIRKTGKYDTREIGDDKDDATLKILNLTHKEIGQLIDVTGKISHRVDNLENKVIDMEENSPLFSVECDELHDLVKKTAIKSLGGYKSPAYNNNSIRGKVFADVQQQLRREFGVKRYKAIKRCQLPKAKEIVSKYTPPLVLTDKIALANNQIHFN